MPSDPSQVNKPYHGGVTSSSAAALTNQQILQDYINKLNAIKGAGVPPTTAVQQVAQANPTALGYSSWWQPPAKAVSEEDEFTKFVQETRMARTKAIVGWVSFGLWMVVAILYLMGVLGFDYALYTCKDPIGMRIGSIGIIDTIALGVPMAILSAVYKESLLLWLNSK